MLALLAGYSGVVLWLAFYNVDVGVVPYARTNEILCRLMIKTAEDETVYLYGFPSYRVSYKRRHYKPNIGGVVFYIATGVLTCLFVPWASSEHPRFLRR